MKKFVWLILGGVIHCCFAENGYEENLQKERLKVCDCEEGRGEQTKTVLKTLPLIFFNATSFRLKNGARFLVTSVKKNGTVLFCATSFR
jgi:hypothetical protein